MSREERPLRVAQVVSYISVDGAFGGPVAVAATQCAGLAIAGHHVQLLAGWDGRGRIVAGAVRMRLHRALQRGLPLTAITAPSLPLSLWLRRRRLDVVHVHLGRDVFSVLVTLALVGFRGRMVLQPHGMVMPTSRPLARVLDVLVIRPALKRAHAVLALTQEEERGLRTVARGDTSIARIRNGVLAASDATTDRPGRPQVLFLARLHARKNAPMFARAAQRLLAEGIDADFVVAGPDEGDLPAVQQAIDAAGSTPRLRYIGAAQPGATQELLRRASVYVLPSVGEVFPMTVLEALAVGTPVVITTGNGLANELRASSAALIVEPTVDALVDGLRGLLLDAGTREELARNGLATVRERFSSTSVTAALVDIYRSPARAR